MANKEGREIAAAYIAEAERLEAAGEYAFYAKWCRAQADVLAGHKSGQEHRASGARQAQAREATP